MSCDRLSCSTSAATSTNHTSPAHPSFGSPRHSQGCPPPRPTTSWLLCTAPRAEPAIATTLWQPSCSTGPSSQSPHRVRRARGSTLSVGLRRGLQRNKTWRSACAVVSPRGSMSQSRIPRRSAADPGFASPRRPWATSRRRRSWPVSASCRVLPARTIGAQQSQPRSAMLLAPRCPAKWSPFAHAQPTAS